MDLGETKRIQPYITICLFCILIFGFAAVTIVKPSDEFSETENRVLQQMPEVKVESILNGRFESDYEEYLADQFVLRDQWIGLKTFVERLLLKRESKDIYFAEEGYLIEKHSGSFTTDAAQRNIKLLAQFSEKYKEQFEEGHMTVMIVPNAVDILEDKLPPFSAPYNEDNYLEEIKASLPEGVWFDSASVLREHTEEPLYYKTDHHWKTLSAFYVYQALAKEKGYAVPELGDYERRVVTDSFEGTIQAKLGIKKQGDTIELFLSGNEAAYTVRCEGMEDNDTLYDYAALDTKDKYAIYFGGNQSFTEIKTDAGMGRKILVIKDSYANCFIPFMLDEFDEIDILDLRYTNRRLSEIVTEGGYTDLLVLYNASGFAEDKGITKLMN